MSDYQFPISKEKPYASSSNCQCHLYASHDIFHIKSTTMMTFFFLPKFVFCVPFLFFLHAVHTGQLVWRRDVVAC